GQSLLAVGHQRGLSLLDPTSGSVVAEDTTMSDIRTIAFGDVLGLGSHQLIYGLDFVGMGVSTLSGSTLTRVFSQDVGYVTGFAAVPNAGGGNRLYAALSHGHVVRLDFTAAAGGGYTMQATEASAYLEGTPAGLTYIQDDDVLVVPSVEGSTPLDDGSTPNAFDPGDTILYPLHFLAASPGAGGPALRTLARVDREEQGRGAMLAPNNVDVQVIEGHTITTWSTSAAGVGSQVGTAQTYSKGTFALPNRTPGAPIAVVTASDAHFYAYDASGTRLYDSSDTNTHGHAASRETTTAVTHFETSPLQSWEMSILVKRGSQPLEWDVDTYEIQNTGQGWALVQKIPPPPQTAPRFVTEDYGPGGALLNPAANYPAHLYLPQVLVRSPGAVTLNGAGTVDDFCTFRHAGGVQTGVATAFPPTTEFYFSQDCGRGSVFGCGSAGELTGDVPGCPSVLS
ncbi:MAG: hypothetical protein D6685_05785, partial [Bacteroidetes bacterium]